MKLNAARTLILCSLKHNNLKIFLTHSMIHPFWRNDLLLVAYIVFKGTEIIILIMCT